MNTETKILYFKLLPEIEGYTKAFSKYDEYNDDTDWVNFAYYFNSISKFRNPIKCYVYVDNIVLFNLEFRPRLGYPIDDLINKMYGSNIFTNKKSHIDITVAIDNPESYRIITEFATLIYEHTVGKNPKPKPKTIWHKFKSYISRRRLA